MTDSIAEGGAGMTQPTGNQGTGAQPSFTEIMAGLVSQLSEEKAFSKGKVAELEKCSKDLSAAQLECQNLNDRLAFIASVIEAEPEQNSGIEKYRKLLDEDYQKYANQNTFHTSGARAMKTLQEVEHQLELVARDSQILGKSIVAVGGAFSSGKSSFMNSLFSQDKVTLPVGMDQTTAIASYVLAGGMTEITGYSYRGARVSVPEKIFSLFTYRKKDEFKLNMKLIIDDIVFKTGFVRPYKNICFVDTPGFNPGSSSELDYNTAITAIAGAQVLLWCFDVSGGTIHDDDFNILQDILNVNKDIKIYIIANRADLKSPEENAEIIEQAEMLLQTNSIPYEGISLYTSRKKFGSQPAEYASAVKGKTLPDFLEENDQQDTRKEDELLRLVRGVFDEYIRADSEQINETKKKIQESKSINSRFQYVLGKKDEIISDIKSRISQKELTRMNSNNPSGADDTEDDIDAVSEIMEENMRVLQATLQKATADRSAAEELCRKFEECVGSIFGDRDVHSRAKDAGNKPEPVDVDEQYSLGEKYYKGDGVEQDYAEAFKWFMKAAEQGHPAAENRVGEMFRCGYGVEQNDSESVRWYRKAAEQDNADAQNILAGMYFHGHGVDQNYAVALKWYQKAAKLGNAFAQYSLGDMYRDGRGVARNYSEAVTWYRMSSEQGNAGAQCSLGEMCRHGLGTKQDYAEAMKLFRQSSERGIVAATRNIGEMYVLGLGVGEDSSKAMKFLQAAAQKGDALAWGDLGMLYTGQYGIEENEEKGLTCFDNAATMGNVYIQYSLGSHYLEDGDESFEKYFNLLKQSGERGDSEAQFYLGMAYQDAAGNDEENQSECFKWFKKAAEQGNLMSQIFVGGMYMEGTPQVNKDYAKAFEWLCKAFDQGDQIDLTRIEFGKIADLDIKEGATKGLQELAQKFNKRAAHGDTEAKRMLTEIGTRISLKDLAPVKKQPSKEERIKKVISDHIRDISKDLSMYPAYLRDEVGPNNEKLRNALSTYAAKVRYDDVIGFIDTSLWGNGKNGLLFAKGGICYDGGIIFTCPVYLHYDEILDMDIDGGKITFTGFFQDKNDDDLDYLFDTNFNIYELKRSLEEIISIVNGN